MVENYRLCAVLTDFATCFAVNLTFAIDWEDRLPLAMLLSNMRSEIDSRPLLHTFALGGKYLFLVEKRWFGFATIKFYDARNFSNIHLYECFK